ncbi:HD-GYP domain-containing protein [Cellulomonas sp. URHD0024]|uniref:HD-GYP domain-containing protein n=1 Tax=Cellulomonas sp. URHD0024 TaxID=1302620 RepID=UPI000406462D|nr:HD-GYP domain-containing protein [Cellulomonas sp. URHD0024]
MAFGPTQNYDDASLGVWKGRPMLAGAIRTVITAVPVLLSVGFGLVAVRWFPPQRIGVNAWAWLVVEVVVATGVLVLATRLARRLLPLTTLLRLTMYFPDRAPSRLAVAMRHYSPNALKVQLAAWGRRRGVRPEDHHADQILDLVAAIGAHDQLTRTHSERVQAYSALIGKELGLSGQDAAKLSWAALLHDVGKLHVPATVLSKPGEPTSKEWDILVGHPEAGMNIARPLREWLGPWLDAIGQHHERWDGAGYPGGLAGTAISDGARIVAVADAYDTITSARSYKRALPASAARAELARCAGQQFDPEVVRAFLAIGLGRLRRIAGPLSLLSALPGLPHLRTDLPSVVQNFTTAGALKATGVVGVVLSISAATALGAPTGFPTPQPTPPQTTRPPASGVTDRSVGRAPSAADRIGAALPAVTPPSADDAARAQQEAPLPSASTPAPVPTPSAPEPSLDQPTAAATAPDEVDQEKDESATKGGSNKGSTKGSNEGSNKGQAKGEAEIEAEH